MIWANSAEIVIIKVLGEIAAQALEKLMSEDLEPKHYFSVNLAMDDGSPSIFYAPICPEYVVDLERVNPISS